MKDLGGPNPPPPSGIRWLPGMILRTLDGGRVVVDYYHPLTGELKVREIDGNDNFAEQGQE